MIGQIGPFTGALLSYLFIKNLTVPFEETEAYKLGIIDKDGNTLIRLNQLTTPEQKRAYTRFHRLCWNLKKILKKVPLISSKLGSFMTAVYLLKEEANYLTKDTTDFDQTLTSYLNLNSKKLLLEDIRMTSKRLYLTEGTKAKLSYGVYDEKGRYYSAGTPIVLCEEASLMNLSIRKVKTLETNQRLWVTYDSIRKD